MNCRLCLRGQTELFFTKPTGEQYWKCPDCDFLFLDPKFHPPQDREKKIYQQHENTIENSGYVDFLNRLIDPLTKMISTPSHGLDFGCGPGPTLHLLMKQKGFKVDLYDPYFYPDSSVLKNKYDFVTCTEVVEHFFEPNKEWSLLKSLIGPNGKIAFMTQSPPATPDDFANWWYHRDITHVGFYSQACRENLGQILGMKTRLFPNGVTIFT